MLQTRAVSTLVVFVLVVPLCGAAELSDRFCLVHGTPEIMVDLGTGWNRFDFSWSGIEPEKGRFDFRDLPHQIAHSLGMGVGILPILDYEPAWDPERSPADEETLALWERYVDTTVRKFKDELPYWQVWNEPNIAFWKPTPNPRDYAELLRRSYRAIKSVDPNLQVLGVNASDIDLEFTEKVFRYGGLHHCDIVAFQPYRIAPEVGHFEEVSAVRELMRRFGGEKPIWFTELGWNSDHFPFSDARDYFAERPARRQAAFLVRYMVLTQVSGIEKAFWFAEGAGGHGLIDRKDNRRRHAFTAYQHLIELLDGWTEVHEVLPAGAFGAYAYSLETEDAHVLVAWSSLGDQSVVIPGLLAAREFRDMLGVPIAPPTSDQWLLTEEPVYALFNEPLPTRTAQFSPAVLVLEPGGTADLTLTSPLPAGGEFSIEGLPARVRSRRTATGFRFAAAPDAPPGRHPVSVVDGRLRQKLELNITPPFAWEVEVESEGLLSPTSHVVEGGPSQLLVGAFDSGRLHCLDSEGRVVWTYEEAHPIHSSPVVAQLTGDSKTEIVFALPSRETIVALSDQGVLLWRTRLADALPDKKPEWDWKSPAVLDLDADGRSEVVYGDSTGVLHALGGDGLARWSRKLGPHALDVTPTIWPPSEERPSNIVVGDAGGGLHRLTAAGESIWSVSLRAPITAPPCIVGQRIAVVTADEQLLVFHENSTILWSASLDGTADLGCGMATTDLNGDGALDIIVSTRNHALLAFSSGGQVLWRFETGAQLRSRPLVEDVSGDEIPEVLIGSADGFLYCIEAEGRLLWRIPVGNRVDASPLLTTHDAGSKTLALPVRGGRLLAWELK